MDLLGFRCGLCVLKVQRQAELEFFHKIIFVQGAVAGSDDALFKMHIIQIIQPGAPPRPSHAA